MSKRNITVIVPIYNAEKYLDSLFECFDKNAFIDGDEILLIDNNSTDASAAMCKEKVEQNPNLYKYLSYTEKADSYATRNCGVRASKGEILAFTDSDCKPTPMWLETIRNDLKEGCVFAGEVKLEVLDNGIWECFDSITHLSQSRIHIEQNQVATANMAVLRSDFDMVGFFEERFAGGDFEWSTRAVSKGLTVFFSEKALIWHPSRKTYEEILTRERRGAYGAGKSAKLHNKGRFALWLRYFLKIFKFDTYIKIAHKMKAYNVPFSQRTKFVFKFFGIRCKQLKSAMAGYKGVDARKIGVK